jgi:hypothetical protein
MPEPAKAPKSAFAGNTSNSGKQGQTQFRAHNPKVAGSNPAPNRGVDDNLAELKRILETVVPLA